jgi:predicted ATPase/class 3 adenylate cyclase
MPEGATLPTGTVTFLFTDIEGSTRLLQQLGDRYPALLEAHQRLLRDSFAGRGGVEVATEGDSFFVVFPAAPPAVAAAVHAQRALAAHAWPEGTEVKVRMGIHTGEGIRGADNYVGLDLHRAARIAAAGHGGQVVVSDTTRALVERSAPEGVTFRDLGEYRLKDLAHPEHLHQAVVEGLPSDFPPLRSMDVPRGNLPKQLTTFIGREHEREEVQAAIRSTRLLTLTGPGGTGKTRLSIQVALDLREEFEDGAFFVPLASLADPSLVIPTIAESLGVPEDPSRMPIESLTDHLAGKEVLLILDNFEQVLEAAPEVGALLTSTERVSILATSREPLGLNGEHEHPVPPLGLPDIRHLPSLESLSQYEAVALFIERARAVRPDFEVTNENAPAVAEITTRLDGLPLAIELAAARTKLLSPEAMLKRLEHRLSLLTTSRRDLPQRQQTLRGAIAWSYDLLEEEDRRLFGRLSVFRGGFTLEAAETICNPDGELAVDTFERVASLANKSLLRQMGTEVAEPRFFMLETIREYAAELLSEVPDAHEIRRRHAGFFLDLAESAEPELTGERQAHWLDALAIEHDNLRSAIEWAVTDDMQVSLRLATALWRFWQMRGHLREGRERIGAILSLPATGNHPRERARALGAAGSIDYWLADFDVAVSRYEESLAIFREMDDEAGVAEALYNLSFALSVPRADLDRARALLEESRGLYRAMGDRLGLAKVSWGLAGLELDLERYAEAVAAGLEALEVFRETGDRFQTGWALHLLGLAATWLGELDDAGERFREGLALFREAGDISGLVLLVGDFGELALARGDGEGCLRLTGALEALQEATGVRLSGWIASAAERREAASRLVPTDVAERALAEGRAMSLDEALTYATEGT